MAKKEGKLTVDVYILGLATSYLSIALWQLRVLVNRVVFSLPILFIGLIIVFRYSGTDTYGIYENILKSILEGQESELLSGLEPGFVTLSKISLWITGSEIWALRFIGLIFILLVLGFIVRADKLEIKFAFLYFIPLLIYQYGMNAVRAGLALALTLLAWQALRRGNWALFGFLGTVSLLFHYSIALVLGLILLGEILRASPKLPRLIVILLGFTTITSLLLLTRWDYFESKITLYSDYESPYAYSGLSRTGIILLIWVLFLIAVVNKTKTTFTPVIRTFTLVVLPSLIFQGLALVSYAGLRLLELMTFVVPLVLIRELDHTKKAGKTFWVGLALAGLIGAGFVYRSFLVDYNGQLTGTLTPFLPYRTIFDYKP
ncbi:EpsG family protein [Meiothermus sp. QL-1]|uniref:EpsG family protein n=1 Tax=Meiothermus sp. QL-1 TaxID=2058095 RepID=UPI0013146B4F|nr:EpsG family protein [Meiothermus sp. QL-1]